jgi:RNA polymerase sigma factor (sigma-70 family)
MEIFPGKLKATAPSLHITVRTVINRKGGRMTNRVRGSVIQSIQTLFNEGSVGGMTDGQLLEQFLSQQHERAEIAFAALVSLHGPMVWDVCRSVLSDPHAAEDAFQATFLILVRKAGSIRRRDAVGPWLHGVARRVARRTKAVTGRQRFREGQGADMSSTPTPDPATREQIEALHEEVDRLNQKYRAPLVLCYFEGCTHAEAARLLKCPVGTVSIRVSRARELLRMRLTRRGLIFPAAWMAAMLATKAGSAAMPAGLAESTIKAAMHVADGKAITAGAFPVAVTQLAEGEIRTMIFTRLTVAVTGVLAVGLVMGGAGVLALHDPPAQVKSAAAPTARTDETVQKARRQSIHNLQVLSLAMHNAISAINQGRFPAAAISKDNKPLLSWRVALLPYLGEKSLYKKFHLDEPWNSPHNKVLLDQMPDVYAPVLRKDEAQTSTYYQVFVGHSALFGDDKGTLYEDVTDEKSSTLMIVEAAIPVPWTKPEDLPFENGVDKPLPKLGGQFEDGFHAAFANGAVLFLSKAINPDLLRALITRNGGEGIAADQLRALSNQSGKR